MTEPRDSELFQALVLQLMQASWASLGKVPNPMTGKIDRDLDAARLAIDTLAAIEVRTRGNLSDDERKLIERALRELRLNYLDERKKDESGQVAAASPSAEGTEPESSRETPPGEEPPKEA